MSKAVGKVASMTPLGQIVKMAQNGTKIKYDGSANDDYADYLAKYDTSKVDKTLSNLQDYALAQSQNINNMGEYYFPRVDADKWTFNVDASEEARRQAQDATYNSYMDRLNPQFERQTADYATMLQNKGIPVGSEAYSRAMSDLQDRQNAAVNQAAYESVLAGQNAYAQDLQNQIAAGNFGNTANTNFNNAQLNANTAQSAYMAQILAALGDAPTESDIQGDIYAARANKAANEYAARQQTVANRMGLVNGLLGAGAKFAGAAIGGAAGGLG